MQFRGKPSPNLLLTRYLAAPYFPHILMLAGYGTYSCQHSPETLRSEGSFNSFTATWLSASAVRQGNLQEHSNKQTYPSWWAASDAKGSNNLGFPWAFVSHLASKSTSWILHEHSSRYDNIEK